jgi:hypothetical protein
MTPQGHQGLTRAGFMTIYTENQVEHRFIRGRLKFKVDTSIQAVTNTDPCPSMIAILFRP